jgi:hypothetical protein
MDEVFAASVASASSTSKPSSAAVVDSGTVGLGVGVCVRAAAQAAVDGASAGEVGALAMRLGLKTRNMFVACGRAGWTCFGHGRWAVLTFADAEMQRIAAHDSPEEVFDPRLSRYSCRAVGPHFGASGGLQPSDASPSPTQLMVLPPAEERVGEREAGLALELVPGVEERERRAEERGVLHEVRDLRLLLRRLGLSPERVHQRRDQ